MRASTRMAARITPRPRTTSGWNSIPPSAAAARRIPCTTTRILTCALRRPFTFYGESRDHLWISSNGWVSFDSMRIPEFRNWELPSPMGAPMMICPFWEDLIGKHTPNTDTDTTIWTLDDAANNRFIIQWRALNRGGMPATPAASTAPIAPSSHPRRPGPATTTSSCSTTRSRSSTAAKATTPRRHPGRYHQRGLTLTFANHYAASVDTLRPGRAIRFSAATPDESAASTGRRTPVMPTRFALHEAYPNPFNPSAMLRFDLPLAGPCRCGSSTCWAARWRRSSTACATPAATASPSMAVVSPGASTSPASKPAPTSEVQKLMLVK